MIHRRLALVLAFAQVGVAGRPGGAAAAPSASSASAAPGEAAARSEARVRFDRGLALFERQHDAPAALAELLRAYELAPAPRTLFVMGLVYAAMNRPVDALHAFDEVVRHPGDLTSDQRDMARARRDEQRQKVGFLRIESNVPADVQVDGLSRGRTPLEADVPVAAGLRVITLESPGYLAARREALVAGETTVPLSFALEPAAPAAPRTVRVYTNVPDAEILVDGAAVGRSPLERPLTLDRKRHVVAARRPCYALISRELPAPTAAAGPRLAEEIVSLRLLSAADAAEAAGCRRGRLSLGASEPHASVSVDGEPAVALAAPLSLPAGRHDVIVTSPGFVASLASLDIPPDRDLARSVQLVPTPQTRAAYEERATSLRRWGRALVVAGAAVALAGGVLTAIEWQKASDAQRDRDRIFGSFEHGRPCDPFGITYTPACDSALASANANVHRQELWRGLSIATAAVGLAAAAIGAVIWGAGPDPHRYEGLGSGGAAASPD